jgi:hypothetical protein
MTPIMTSEYSSDASGVIVSDVLFPAVADSKSVSTKIFGSMLTMACEPQSAGNSQTQKCHLVK